MRTIGIMPVWAREELVLPALQQAVEMLVDELYVTVACFHPSLAKYEDYTESIVRDFCEGHDNATLVEYEPQHGDDLDRASGRAYQTLLEAAGPEPGDLIWKLDADEFYPKQLARETAEVITQTEKDGDWANIAFRTRMIGPDMNHFVRDRKTRLYKFWETRRFLGSGFFRPSSEPVVVGHNYPMHHYSFLVDRGYRTDMWDCEFKQPPEDQQDKINWWQQVFFEFSEVDEEWKARNEQTTGTSGFSWGAFEEPSGGGVFEMDGPHPEVIYRYGLDEYLEHFRWYFTMKMLERRVKSGDPIRQDVVDVFQEGAEDYFTIRDNLPLQAPACEKESLETAGGLDEEDAPGSRGGLDVQLGRSFDGVTVVLGPWAGELGYEAASWVPVTRALTEKMDAGRVVAICPVGHEVLYEGLADEVETHSIDLGPSRWKANSGDARFSRDEWESIAPECAEEVHRVRDFIQDLRQQTKVSLLEPAFELHQLVGHGINPEGYGRDVPKSGRILLHCRRAGHGRDWPDEEFDKLVAFLNSHRIEPVIIGTDSDYLPEGVVKDRRGGPDIRPLIEELSGASLLVGASSGPMHLAAMCGCPHLVWGDGDTWNAELNAPLKKVYSELWNPLDTPVRFLDEGWNPPFAAVAGAIQDLAEKGKM